MLIRVLVLATNANGSPEFHPFTSEIDQANYDDGLHYDWAMDEAKEDGYKAPMLAFDEHDEAAHQMGEQFYALFKEG